MLTPSAARPKATSMLAASSLCDALNIEHNAARQTLTLLLFG